MSKRLTAEDHADIVQAGIDQATKEAQNNPGTKSPHLDESVIPTTPSLEAAKKVARGK